jgi:hypothetical protein
MRMEATPLEMSMTLTKRLAALDGASDEDVEATIALWPLGLRISLAADDIIDTRPDVEAASRGETSDFRLTETGREVIEACAAWVKLAQQTLVPPIPV